MNHFLGFVGGIYHAEADWPRRLRIPPSGDAVGVELDSANILMKDGTLVGGTILGQTGKAVIILSPHLGVLRIPGSQIEKIARFNRNYPVGHKWSFDNPNYTRAFVMPTANTLPAGRVTSGL